MRIGIDIVRKSIISCIFVCSTYSWKRPVQIGVSRDTIHHVKRKLVKSILHSSGGGATESALSSISVRPILVLLRISSSRILYFLSQNLIARENSTPKKFKNFEKTVWKNLETRKPRIYTFEKKKTFGKEKSKKEDFNPSSASDWI